MVPIPRNKTKFYLNITHANWLARLSTLKQVRKKLSNKDARPSNKDALFTQVCHVLTQTTWLLVRAIFNMI